MYMRSFYLLLLKYPTLSDKLKNINVTWSNVCEIMQLKNSEKMKYYLELSNKLCLTKRELREKIKSKEYERLDSKIKEKLVKQEEVSVKDKIPDPIVLEGLESKERLT